MAKVLSGCVSRNNLLMWETIAPSCSACVHTCVCWHVCCCLPRLHMSTVADILVDMAAAESHAARALCNALPCCREHELTPADTQMHLAHLLVDTCSWASLHASGHASMQWQAVAHATIVTRRARSDARRVDAHTCTHLTSTANRTTPGSRVAGSHRTVRVEWMRTACCSALLCATR
jgi:hypothetical protein